VGLLVKKNRRLTTSCYCSFNHNQMGVPAQLIKNGVKLILLAVSLFPADPKVINKDIKRIHCKPGEAYTRLITASCEAGPGTTHMWILDICKRSLLILEFATRYVFHNSIFGLSKCYLYMEFRKYLKLSCQGSNRHPFNSLW
jgi:hypothetical protein